VQPGTCYRLYPRALYASHLPPYNTPELQRVPLEELALQILHLELGGGPCLLEGTGAESRGSGRLFVMNCRPVCRILCPFPALLQTVNSARLHWCDADPATFLSRAMDPPDSRAVTAAMETLEVRGACMLTLLKPEPVSHTVFAPVT
jgi:HrpA-like RNA helicase